MRARGWALAICLAAAWHSAWAQSNGAVPPPQAGAPGPQPQINISTRSAVDLAALSPCLDLLYGGAGPGGPQSYRVERGDTLSAIATRFYHAASGYQSIARYHNEHRGAGDHPAIRTDTYLIVVGGLLRLPPRNDVAEAAPYTAPMNVNADNGRFEVPGSGSVYPLVVTAANCLVHSDQLHIPAMAPYKGTITVTGPGTGYGRTEFCKKASAAYMASDRASYNLVTECQKPLSNRPHLEIAIARDAVVVVLNRSFVHAEPSLDNRKTPGYVTLTAAQACALLSDTAGYWRRAHRYLSTKASGTLHFVGRRLCNDDAAFASDLLEPDSARTEKYDDLAFLIAQDDHGVGYLPYAFYFAQRDHLVPVAINGVPPILELATPDPDASHSCEEAAKSTYCLSRYLWVYADRQEILHRAGLYRLLHLLLSAPTLIERAHYLPLTAEMRQGELVRLDTGK